MCSGGRGGADVMLLRGRDLGSFFFWVGGGWMCYYTGVVSYHHIRSVFFNRLKRCQWFVKTVFNMALWLFMAFLVFLCLSGGFFSWLAASLPELPCAKWRIMACQSTRCTRPEYLTHRFPHQRIFPPGVGKLFQEQHANTL